MILDAVLDDVAHARPGYTLATFKQAALPVYLLTVRVLVLEKKTLSPIEEACLRAIDSGLALPTEIGKFLGLPTNVLTVIIAALNSRECINYSRAPGESAAKVSLTAKGRLSLREAVAVTPQERVVQLVFDPYLKRVLFIPTAALSRPREVKEQGWLELPLCGAKRPEADDIPLKELDRVVAKIRNREEEARELLAIRRVERREMHFLPFLLLFYKANQGEDVQVAFYQDDGFSLEHETAFRAMGGAEQVGARHVLPPVDVAVVGKSAGKFQAEIDEAIRSEAQMLQTQQRTEGQQEDGGLQPQNTKAKVDKRATQAHAKTLRVVRCHEHPRLLRKALGASEDRLLIVAPWIRDQVVDRDFIAALEALLRNGVDVYIGYGLTEEDGKAKANDQARSKLPISRRAKADLEGLQQRFKNFNFRFVGNTHRKFLVSDDKFAVSTSFNWLSFLGDPKERARDESGLLVTKAEYVEEMFKDALDLLEHGYDHPTGDRRPPEDAAPKNATP